jgi:type IV pilus assembly protein PilX
MKRSRQYGFALITALLLLVGLTLLGVAALRTSIFDEKAAGNLAFRANAHNLAESALNAGLVAIQNLYAERSFVGASPPLAPPLRIARRPGGAGDVAWKDASFWNDSNSVAVPIAGLPASKYPRYSAELLQNERSEDTCPSGSSTDVMCRDWYRITARAVDPTTGAAVILQTTHGNMDAGQ